MITHPVTDQDRSNSIFETVVLCPTKLQHFGSFGTMEFSFRGCRRWLQCSNFHTLHNEVGCSSLAGIVINTRAWIVCKLNSYVLTCWHWSPLLNNATDTDFIGGSMIPTQNIFPKWIKFVPNWFKFTPWHQLSHEEVHYEGKKYWSGRQTRSKRWPFGYDSPLPRRSLQDGAV